MSTEVHGFDERRQHIRLAATGPVEVMEVDEHDRALRALEDVNVVNVSAGGLAFKTATTVEPGARLAVHATPLEGAGEPGAVIVEVIEAGAGAGGGHMVRCRLVEGKMPAALLEQWP